MAEFINTIDALGDDAVIDSIIQGTITEFKDDQVKRIDEYTFWKCGELVSVDVPSVTEFGYCAFHSCSKLRSINAPLVTKAANQPFWNCVSLVEVDFPLCTTLGASGGAGFYGCSSLSRVNLPKLIYADNGCFRSTALTNVVLPSVTSVGINAFSSCNSLLICDLPVATYFGGSCFSYSGNLAALIIRNTEAPAELASTNAFIKSSVETGAGFIYVPRALVDSYKTATNWSTYASQFRAIEDYTVDGTVTGALDETKI